jgi:hypothetical protein
MARRYSRNWSPEGYSMLTQAQERFGEIAANSGERGGPWLSLVPEEKMEEARPADQLPAPAATPDEAAAEPEQATPFDGFALTPSRRLAGWSAERQRRFLATLAETGSVHEAADATGLNARSAYQLRTRSPAFAAAWDTALQLAVGRLSALVFDRAIYGRVEQLYADGAMIGERRVPSDKLLTWLLARLDPKRFALPSEQRGEADLQAAAVARFPALLGRLEDTADRGSDPAE